MSLKVSAPGKLVLFGEHAVVYGRPSIVTAVEQRLTVQIDTIDEPALRLKAPNVGIDQFECPLDSIPDDAPKGASFVLAVLKRFGEAYSFRGGLQIDTTSDLQATVGFGSSSAVAVCTTKALAEISNIEMTEKEIFEMSYGAVLDVQGSGSGVDVAASVYGGTVLYEIGGKRIEPLSIDSVPMVIGYTGYKSHTPTILAELKLVMESNPERINTLYDSMGEITEEAFSAMNEESWEEVGVLANKNQNLLRELTVSDDVLDALILNANDAGAFGAKLSGAGRGDCMFAFCSPETRSNVVTAVESAGGEFIDVGVHAEGVKVER